MSNHHDPSFSYLSSSKIPNSDINGLFLYDFPEEDKPKEIALWRSVITQALMDAGSNSHKKEMKKVKAQAISWLTGESDDLRDVCALAELNFDYVRGKSIEAIKRGCKWRKNSEEARLHKEKESRRVKRKYVRKTDKTVSSSKTQEFRTG